MYKVLRTFDVCSVRLGSSSSQGIAQWWSPARLDEPDRLLLGRQQMSTLASPLLLIPHQ
jgi:hypothetical protein